MILVRMTPEGLYSHECYILSVSKVFKLLVSAPIMVGLFYHKSYIVDPTTIVYRKPL